MSNSERAKKYRERQKALNLEEFREKEKKRSKINYSKLKGEVIDNNDNNDNNDNHDNHDSDNHDNDNHDNDNHDSEIEEKEYLANLIIDKIDETGFIIYKPISKRINVLNKSKLQPQTVKLYLNCFKNVYKRYTNLDIDDIFESELMNLLNNSNYNVKYIKEKLNFLKDELYPFIKTLNKNEIKYIYSIFTRIPNYTRYVIRLYPYLLQKQIEYQHSRENYKIDAISKNKYNTLSFAKADVLKILNHWNDDKNETDDDYLTIRDKLLYGLFTLFPVRRPIDYKRMYLIDKEPYKEEKKQIYNRNNYYYNGFFYFYRTKNKEIQKFKVPDELNDIIDDYIQERRHGTLLLDNNNNPYNSSTLKNHILTVFGKIYKKGYSALELRHYYSTYIKYLVKNKQITLQEHVKISNMMNHSYNENKKYAYLID